MQKFSVRPELVEGHRARRLPFDKLRANGGRVRTALCTLVLVLQGGFAFAAPAPAAAPKSIRDPHYGDVLFNFYQERYFTSITNLMVSQHFARMPNHGDEAEVLRGGLLLSYGMHREAGEIFAKLIERNAAPAVRDRAWYYLAKIRYQRGFIAEAEQALSLIQKNLPPDLEQDRVLLKANVQMAREDFTGAIATLDALADVNKEILQTTPSVVLYARYNLGVALVRSGDSARGSKLLDQLGRAPTPPKATDEFRSLRDKANVALGFTALKDNKLDDAYKFLERVRLNGHSESCVNRFSGRVAEFIYLGDHVRIRMEVCGKPDFFVKQPIAELDPALAVGDVVPLGWQVEHVRALDPLLAE